MQRKFSKNNVYNAGKNSTNQDLVFQHMCNHYRRILNAKKAVDTSPPYCYKVKRPTTHNPAAVIKPTLPNRNISPALTERSILSDSFKGSYWGAESYVGSSRYHVTCIQEGPTAPAELTCIDMGLIDRITYDTKNGPAAYCDEGWMEVKAQHNDKRYKAQFETKSVKKVPNTTTNPKRRIQNKLTDLKQKRKFSIQEKLTPSELRGNQNQFVPYDAKFYPRVSKTEAVSKLRSLRVYYPPRRRIKSKTEPETPIGCSPASCKCTNICVCDAHEGSEDLKKNPDNPKESQTSSRDSAYNGGVSSLPVSRSPTPDQRRKKECTCGERERYFSEKKDVKVFEKKEDWKNSRDSDASVDEPSGKNDSSMPVSSAAASKTEAVDQKESLRKMQEEALYIKFIHDITTEILERCLYTNKALKKVMKRHVMDNLETLDKERMLKEVDNLRIQLGIPEDKNLLDLEVDINESSNDLLNLYPVISDSEFVMAKNVISEEKEGQIEAIKQPNATENDADDDKGKEKTIFGSGTDEDDISVIQVAKTIREKRKGRSEEKIEVLTASQGSSADESDQSSENKQKWKIQSEALGLRNRSFSSSSSSSSLSSSENEDLKKSPPEDKRETKQTEGETSAAFANDPDNPTRSVSSNLGKKSRSVSFRNNEDLNMRETIKIKHKKTLTSLRTTTEKKKENL